MLDRPGGRPRKLQDAVNLTTRVPAALVERLEAYAAEEGINRGSAVRRLLETELRGASFSPASSGGRRNKQRASQQQMEAGGYIVIKEVAQEARPLLGSLPGSRGGRGGRPKTMENGRCISFHLPKPLVEEIEAGAALQGTSRSNAICGLLKRALRLKHE